MVNLMRVLSDLDRSVTYAPQTLGNREELQRLRQLAAELGVALPPERSVKSHIRRSGASYGVAILCRPGPTERYLPMLRRFCPGTRVLFDTVDLHHLRELRQSEIEGNRSLRRSALEVRQTELQLVASADATIVVSTAERDLLQQERPTARIRVVSNIHHINPPGPGFADRSGLLFVAGFDHSPNVDAAVWLVDAVMPQVWQRLPAVELRLVGSNPPAKVRSLQRSQVRVTGWVPSIEPYLHESRLAVAPLRFGAGVKGKITQSLAAGLPVVATPLAGEGMPIEHERDILMADEATDLAQTIVRAYEDEALWNRLADNGRKTASRHFSFEAARRAVDALMQEIISSTD